MKIGIVGTGNMGRSVLDHKIVIDSNNGSIPEDYCYASQHFSLSNSHRGTYR